MRRAPLVLAILLLAACGGSPTGPNPGGGGGGADKMTATIDGQAFAATLVQANPVSTVPGSLSFTGVVTSGSTARSISIALGFIPGPGTYPLGMNIGSSPGGTANYVSGSSSWLTPLTGAAGTITITTLSATRVVGTFSFTAPPIVGGGANVVVTNGTFDVPRSTGYTVPTADEAGSTIRATINGSPFVGATVIGIGGGTETRVIGGNNTVHSFSIIVGPISGPGGGALTGSTVPLRKVTVQLMGTVQSWGGAGNDVGTLTITAITATRITGTFSGTLAPNAGTTGSLVVTNGTFDIRTPTQ